MIGTVSVKTKGTVWPLLVSGGEGVLFFSFPGTSSLIMAQHLKPGNGREEHGFFLNRCDLRASGASCISHVTSTQTILGFSVAEERTEPSFLPLYFLKPLTISLCGKEARVCPPSSPESVLFSRLLQQEVWGKVFPGLHLQS